MRWNLRMARAEGGVEEQGGRERGMGTIRDGIDGIAEHMLKRWAGEDEMING